MHAVTMSEPGGPEVLDWSEVPDLSPGSGELRVEVVAAGVNRADLMQRQGHYPPPPGASDIIGLECAGRVVEVGDQVTGWDVGAECVALLVGGGYAEQVVVPVGQVLSPPQGVDLVIAGGLIEVAATVVSNLDLAELRPGGSLLVHGGAGGIGSLAIQYAKQLGATVFTTAGSADKLDYCRSLGADHLLNYHEDWAAAVQQLTDGAGVDAILDNMGASYLAANVSCLAQDGRLMVIGMQGGRQGTLDLGALMAKRGAVFSTSLRARPVEAKSAICGRVAESVWPMISSGTIAPTRHRTFGLDRAADAHRLMESGDNLGKIILVRPGDTG